MENAYFRNKIFTKLIFGIKLVNDLIFFKFSSKQKLWPSFSQPATFKYYRLEVVWASVAARKISPDSRETLIFKPKAVFGPNFFFI